MATIFPEDQRYHDPESPAERKLYPLLAGLPRDYTVYCNRSWLAPPKRRKGAPRPAEADFLVAHPDRGVLVLEVKGGAIRHDPATDRWWSNDNLLDKSPFKQVELTRYLLRDVLKKSEARGIQFPLGEALAFPDIRFRSRDLGAGYVPERVIDGTDLDAIETAVVRAFDTWDLSGKAAVFGARGVRALTDAVAGSIKVERNIGQELAEAERQLVELTENQYEILDSLDSNPRMVVKGGAGTGKTLLAIEQARRLAARGHSVLLTCFNNPLSAYMKRELASHAEVDVMNFHLLCRVWAGDAGLDAQKRRDEPDADYYDERLPSLLMEAAGKLDRRYDAILVDEAQDFEPDWLTILQLLLRDERRGIFYLFADENQAIYRHDFVKPEGFPEYHLNANLRNTAAIHSLLARHFGEQSRAKGPQGIDVTAQTWRTDRDLRDGLSRLLSNWSEHGVPTSKITILTGRGRDGSLLNQDGGKVGAFRVTPKRSGPNDVRLESVHRFKGLESPVVVLLELEEVHRPVRRSLWYTGLSRAQVGLVVFIRDEDGSLDGCDLDQLIDHALEA